MKDMNPELLAVIDQTLNLGGRAFQYDRETPLLGAIPELDSMAVVALINAIEERFGILVEDDEMDGSVFGTVGSLLSFVEGKQG